jgi:FkbM family methyltransferase
VSDVSDRLPGILTDLDITPRHLVHVGAHEGQEVPAYLGIGIPRITLVEPIPELAAALRDRYAATPAVEVVECACADAGGTATLHVMQWTNMSTLLPPAPRDHLARCVTVQVRRLDEIAPDADVAVIDAQGAELDVLRAAPWDSLELVVVETCTVDDPTVAALYGDVIGFAESVGFVEIGRWVRDYSEVDQWARLRDGVQVEPGEIRDVILARRT